jgi:hypothetical protein
MSTKYLISNLGLGGTAALLNDGLAPGVPAAGSVALSGTVIGGVPEAAVVTGGKTLIFTLTGDTWVPDDGTFAAARQDLIDAVTADGAETHGWNNEVTANQGVSGLVRTSDTIATLTLDAEAAYDITLPETVGPIVVPASLLVGGAPLTAPETFDVTPTGVKGAGADLALASNGGTLRRILRMGH